MSSEAFSLLMRCIYQQQTDTTQVQVVHVDSNETVRFSDGNFLLRIAVDTDAAIVRCMIRHLTSGREAHVQGGLNLRTFVKDCLLAENKSLPGNDTAQP